MDLFCWYGQPNPPPPKKTKKKKTKKQTETQKQKKQKQKKRRKKTKTKKEQNIQTNTLMKEIHLFCGCVKNSNLILSCHNHKMWFLFVSFLLPHWFCFVIFFNLFAIIYFIHNRVVIDHFMRLVVVYWSGQA